MNQDPGRPRSLVSLDGGSARISEMLDIAQAQQRAAGLCRELELDARSTFDVMRGVSDLSQELLRSRGQCLLSMRGLSDAARSCLVITSEYWDRPESPTERGIEDLLEGLDEVAILPGQPSRVVALKWAAAEAGHGRTHRRAAH